MLTNSCGANQAQDFFQVINHGTAPVTVSDISIKLWVDETSASNVVAQINTGGCLLNATGSCVHSVTGVTATATKFSPACGPDPGHQANWEITISNTDHSALGAGLIWSNIQTALHLANFANFSPGEADWYSSCLAGSKLRGHGDVCRLRRGKPGQVVDRRAAGLPGTDGDAAAHERGSAGRRRRRTWSGACRHRRSSPSRSGCRSTITRACKPWCSSSMTRRARSIESI